MEIVVCGVGEVGYGLVKYLINKGNNVTVVDIDPNLIKNIDQQLDVKSILGHAAHPDILKKTNLANADILIAATNIDEVNMVICEVAHALFEVPKKIARVRSQAYLKMKGKGMFSDNNLSIDYAISPEGEIAHAIARTLRFYGISYIVPFAEGNFYVVTIQCCKDTKIINTTIKYLPSIMGNVNISIVAIIRNEQNITINLDTEILYQDKISYVVSSENIEESIQAFGYIKKSLKELIIVGGGNIGYYLAQEVEAYYPHINLKLIELDKGRANFISPNLSRTIVINGDGLDSDILYEAGVENADLMIAITENDKTNILTSILAKKLGTNRVMCLTNNELLANLVNSLGVDSVINPYIITVSKIMEFVSSHKINFLCTLNNKIGELIEIAAVYTKSLIGDSVSHIAVKTNIIVAAIIRDDEYIIPHSSEIILNSDQLILMVPSDYLKKAYDFLEI